MHAPKWTLAGLLVITLLSGCADDAELEEEEPAVPLEREVRLEPQVKEENFGWMAAVGAPTGQDVQMMASNAMSIHVPEGAGSLGAGATWTCSSPTCELHFFLYPPGAGPGDAAAAHETGTGSVNLTVDAPEPGEWLLAAHSNAATMDVAGTMRMVAG